MKLVERDQPAMAGDDVNSQLEIVCPVYPIVGNYERIRKQHDAPLAVWILNEQSAARSGKTHDRCGRDS